MQGPIPGPGAQECTLAWAMQRVALGSHNIRHHQAGLGADDGVCDGGVASGRGYGLIVNDRGDSIEFIGDARNGLAWGSGGMIIQRRGQLGATYYEGGFRNGLPDGVVRVENAGQIPKLREYRLGTDIGKGHASKLRSLKLASTSNLSGPSSP